MALTIPDAHGRMLIIHLTTLIGPSIPAQHQVRALGLAQTEED